MKFLKSRTGAVVAGAATLALLGGTGAAVGDGQITGRDIKDGSIKSRDVDQLFSGDISNQTLHSWDLSENSVGSSELKDEVESSFAKSGHDHDDRYYTKEESDARYAQKSDIPAPTAVELTRENSDGLVRIANIGGKFAERRTEVDSFDLQPGTYQLTSDGFFTSTEPTSGQTRLQLALRTTENQELGTCFTGTASELANREITCSTARVVTLDQPTTVKVYAFGYADDQGSADSGRFSVASIVNLLKVG